MSIRILILINRSFSFGAPKYSESVTVRFLSITQRSRNYYKLSCSELARPSLDSISWIKASDRNQFGRNLDLEKDLTWTQFASIDQFTFRLPSCIYLRLYHRTLHLSRVRGSSQRKKDKTGSCLVQ